MGGERLPAPQPAPARRGPEVREQRVVRARQHEAHRAEALDRAPEVLEPALVEGIGGALPCLEIHAVQRRGEVLEHDERRAARLHEVHVLEARGRRLHLRAREPREPAGESAGRLHQRVAGLERIGCAALAPEPHAVHRGRSRLLAPRVHLVGGEHHLRFGDRRVPVDAPAALRQAPERVAPAHVFERDGARQLAFGHLDVPAVGGGRVEAQPVCREMRLQGRGQRLRLVAIEVEHRGVVHHHGVALDAQVHGVGAQPRTGARRLLAGQRDRGIGRGRRQAEALREPALRTDRVRALEIGAREPALERREARFAQRRGRIGRWQQVGDEEVERHGGGRGREC
jgi:hypothetical protein